MNAFSGDSEDDFDFRMEAKLHSNVGVRRRSYDSLGLVDGELAADGV